MRDGESKEPKNTDLSAEAERRFFAEDPALDPYDLSGLRPKPRPLRTALALLVILACSYLLYDLRHEFSYFFQASGPTELGDLDDEGAPERGRLQITNRDLPSNSYVHLSATPDYPPFIWETLGGLGRGPGAGEHARLVTFPLKEGEQGGINHRGEVVQRVRFPLAVIYYENNFVPREQLRGDFEGRLLLAKDAPSLTSVRQFLWKNYSLEIPEDAYILLAGEVPSGSWVYAVLLALLLGAIGFNLVVLARQLSSLRPRKA